MNEPSSTDWAYLAGLLDGEGSFTVIVNRRQNRKTIWHRGRRREGKGLQLMPIISFGVKGPHMPLWVKMHFGGLAFSRNVGDMWNWRLTKLEAVEDMLGYLLPFLKIKRDQAEILLLFVQERRHAEQRDGRYHAPYSERCFGLANKVRSLNGNHKRIELYDSVAA